MQKVICSNKEEVTLDQVQFALLKKSSKVVSDACGNSDSTEESLHLNISKTGLDLLLRFLDMKKVDNFLTDFNPAEQYTILSLIDFLAIDATFGKKKRNQKTFKSFFENMQWSNRLAILKYCVTSKEDLPIPTGLLPENVKKQYFDQDYKYVKKAVLNATLEINSQHLTSSTFFGTYLPNITHIFFSDDESTIAYLTSNGNVHVRTNNRWCKIPGTMDALGLSLDGRKIIVARNKQGTISIKKYKTHALDAPKAEFTFKISDMLNKKIVHVDKEMSRHYGTLHPKILMHPDQKHFCILGFCFFLHNFHGKLDYVSDFFLKNKTGHIFADGSLHIWCEKKLQSPQKKAAYCVKKFDQFLQHTQEPFSQTISWNLISYYLKIYHHDKEAFYKVLDDTELLSNDKKKLSMIAKENRINVVTTNNAGTVAVVGENGRCKRYNLEPYFTVKSQLDDDLDEKQQALLLVCYQRRDYDPPLPIGECASYRTLPDLIKQSMQISMNVTTRSSSTLDMLSNDAIGFYYKAKVVAPYLIVSAAVAGAGYYGLKKMLQE